ncbi:MAG TPA: DUF1036 domain-containing protein [Coleofasciculaceae cyanobacterium]
MTKNLSRNISTIASLVLTTSAFWTINSVLNPNKALAWFEVCNRSSKRAYVAFAYYNARDNRDTQRAPVPDMSQWVSEGWWTLNPGQCRQVYPHELWRRNKYYYVYAESDGNTLWRGNHYFCVGRGVPFRITQADLATIGGLRGCGGTGIDDSSIKRVPFKQVEITGRTQNFTYSLNN